MQEYQKAELEVIYFGRNDIVVTSGDPEDTAEDMDDW